MYARTVRNQRTPDLAATRSVIALDYDEWTRVFIATNHGLDVPYPALQHSYVQWEGSAGVMRAQMGVNLDYPKVVAIRWSSSASRTSDSRPVAANRR